ncbi:sulfite reductase flavoprotein subunit alpha [soil metagenome]
MSDPSGLSLVVGYASDMGTAEYIAYQLTSELKTLGIDATEVELNEVELTDLQAATHLVVVASTFGDGEMPDNGALFWEALAADGVESLPNLNYAVLALGDSSYDLFCNAGLLVDDRLAELGATRLLTRVDLDCYREGDATSWMADVVKLLEETRGSAPPVTSDAVSAAAPAAREHFIWDSGNPFTARLTVNRRLTAPDSDKDVRHYEIDLGNSGITYQAGDSIAVHPVNDPDLVESILAQLGVSPDHMVAEHEETLGVLLSEHLEIRNPPRALHALVSGRATVPVPDFPGTHDVLDLLEFADVDVDELLDTLRPLQFRDYSIASSPLEHPGHVHLTVATVQYTTSGRHRGGVASTFLAHRGDAIRVHPRPNHAFRLPGPDVPIIMVGPGTGIAPFRAFLRERQVSKAPGKSWLFFGDRRRATDFLYGEELQAHLESGVLARLDLAFSRDRATKDYVQHHMLANADELFTWLQEGAYFYVCGDADHMAKDVDRALHEVVRTAGALTEEAAHNYVNELIKAHRYVRDVY